MRLFVSIDFPETILKEIYTWIPNHKGWKKSSIHQMHLTLVFLGNCTEREKDEIDKQLSQIDFEPFDIVLEGLGAFPNESSPRIMWAGVQENKKLQHLQQRIFDRLEDYLKSTHTDAYIPHITLARKKSRKGVDYQVKQNLGKKTSELRTKVESFQLKRSILKQTGSEHEILKSYMGE